MGKKGKKSKRQKGIKLDANEVALIKILNNMQKMQALVYDKIEKKQYSEAASRERDAITYLATQENAMTNASVALAKSRRDEQGGNHFATALVESYRVLMFIEFDFRKNYGNVIEVYNDLASKYSHLVTLDTQILEENVPSSISIDMKSLQLFYELALIRTDKSLSKIPIIKSFILREMKDEATMKDETTGKKIMILKAHTIDALRVVKEYKTAIDLDGELVLGNIANLLESKPFETTASLLVSFVERYRIEKYQSLPSAKARNYSVMYGLLHSIPEELMTMIVSDMTIC
ncbi:predicted protein [Chaetoceros tenuissimus]|uniref:Uncharacterized protein n=1 Tax=Chaetoceros tenuissimus TaxID=426638 RepID=A0AAD3D598_9STRA|nr:predicted protein [Chaetoceros tenuissimus]